jgi:hypothetical protein
MIDSAGDRRPEQERDPFAQTAAAFGEMPSVGMPDAIDRRHGKRRHGSDEYGHG